MKNLGTIISVLIILAIIGASLYFTVPNTNPSKAQQTQGTIGLGMLLVSGLGLSTLLISNIAFSI